MSNRFNLLLLNSNSDKHPRSWICVNGEKLKKTISKIEKEVIKSHNLNREQLSKIIAKNLSINHVSIKNILRKGKFFPIPVLLELCKLSEKEELYKREIREKTEFLKVNSASSKPIKAVKVMSENLARIIGAFCADGSLSMQLVIASKNKKELEKVPTYFRNLGIKESKSRSQYYCSLSINKNNYNNFINFQRENKFLVQSHYTIELSDEYQSNVEAFNKWIFSEFKIKPNSFYQKDTAWRTIFSNKILARYLMTFFGFLPGYKTDIVAEPEIIRKSSLKIRKEFAKGVIMFDGCVTKQKRILFSTISLNLANSIKEIWGLDGIKFYESFDKRGSYNLGTTKDNKIEKMFDYFESGTQKWAFLKWLEGDITQSIKIDKKTGSLSLSELLGEIRKKECDASFLMKRFRCSHTTIRDHLKILKSQKKIRLSNNPKRLNEFIDNSAKVLLKKDFHDYLFNQLEKKFKTYENLSKFIGVHKATLSTWKIRKSRIPLRITKEFCNILQINPEIIWENIENTDREIAEII